MSIKSRRTRKIKKLPSLPNINVENVLSQEVIADLQRMEDKLALSHMDHDGPVGPTKYTAIPTGFMGPSGATGPWYSGPIGATDWTPDFVSDTKSIDAFSFNRNGFAEAEKIMKDLYQKRPELKNEVPVEYVVNKYTKGSDAFYPEEAWIQTYSGKRFTPMRPNASAIVIQDIAHALSMQCRFSGHVKQFYSVAQHCVLVSHICNSKDALWGLLHDATEAYLVDIPRPLKRSGKLENYIEAEKVMQDAICERWNLSKEEPESVRRADTVLLATEARDLMGPLREDWTQPVKPLPFKIEPLQPREAKLLYLERFFELIGHPAGFNKYLEWETSGLL